MRLKVNRKDAEKRKKGSLKLLNGISEIDIPKAAPEKNFMECTIKELQRHPNVKVVISGGKTAVQVKSPESTMAVFENKFSAGEDRKVSLTPKRNKNNKDEYDRTVIERLKSGQTQNEVAFTMGISQPRVSQIKKKYSDKSDKKGI